MYCGSPSSVTQAENCAESAMTLAPQMAATISNAIGFAPNNNPIKRQQIPLIAIAADAVNEIRCRFAERQRANQYAERQAAPVPKPGRENFHRRRIDTREKHSR